MSAFSPPDDSRRGGCIDASSSSAAARHSSIPPAQQRPIAAGFASTVSNLKMLLAELLLDVMPLLLEHLVHAVVPHGHRHPVRRVRVRGCDRHVESPTETDFQPPLNPRWHAAFT